MRGSPETLSGTMLEFWTKVPRLLGDANWVLTYAVRGAWQINEVKAEDLLQASRCVALKIFKCEC